MLGIVVGLAAEARVAAGLGGRVAVGGGTTAGAAAAARRLLAEGANALLSFGLAGGLDPALAAGTVLVPIAVLDGQGHRWTTDPALNATLQGDDVPSTLLACSAIIATAADKRALWQRFATAAADMESGAVAQAAAAANVPFAVLRAICDPADGDLPAAALATLNAQGGISAWRLLRSVAGQPTQIPALLRLGGQANQARAALLRRVSRLSR